MGDDDGMTLGEVGRRLAMMDRRLDQLTGAIDARMADVRSDIARLSYVGREAYEADKAAIKDSLRNQWAVIMVLIVALVGYFVANSQVFGS